MELLTTGYTERWLGTWYTQRRSLEEIYERRYGFAVKVKRVKSDTKGLFMFEVYRR